MDSRQPCSTASMNSTGMALPDKAFSKENPDPLSPGSTSTFTIANSPAPPVCLMYSPTPVAVAEIVSL